MQRPSISTTAALALFALLSAPTLAFAQTAGAEEHHPEAGTEVAPAPDADTSDDTDIVGPGMMGPGMMRGMMSPQVMQMMPQGMMGSGMMGSGMMGTMMGGGMGPGMVGHGMAMRVMFILLDTDGDGALSLEEARAAQARIFSVVDADDDGRVTQQELQIFVHGTAGPGRQMPMRRQGMRAPDRGMPMQGAPGQGMPMQSMPMQGTPDQAMPMQGAPSEASQAYMDAMRTMMDGMASLQMTGDANADFARMMIPHHQSAIDMAEAFLQRGDDPDLAQLATEIIAAQRAEIEFLQEWLDDR